MEFISVESIANEVAENAVTEPIGGVIAVSTYEIPVDETTTENAAEEEIHIYNITANHKKSTYQIEHWTNVLSNGKHVTLLVYTYFYWGTFEIELTDKEKEEILKKEDIVLNDYIVSCPELDSGCDCYEEIENEDIYTKEELDELNKLIYWHKDSYDEEYNADTKYNLDQDILELNDWDMDDTIYGFDTGCELELISD